MRWLLLLRSRCWVPGATLRRSIDAPRSVLKNPGFESHIPLDVWQIVVYGAAANVALDDHNVHEGRHALRVSADTPSDGPLAGESRSQAAWLVPVHRLGQDAGARPDGIMR